MPQKLLSWQLKDKINLSFIDKIKLSKIKIKQFIKELDNKVYVAFSGGLDSTVLLHLVRGIDPDILAVRVIESSYHELNDFVNTFENIKQIKPSKSYNEVIKEYGYPVISKEVSKNISRYRTGNDDVKRYRMFGVRIDGSIGKIGVIPNKWHYLVNAPFKISDRCCDIIKKNPIKKFEKEYKLKPFIGIKANDSLRRRLDYLKKGCNIFLKNREQSRPLSFWTKRDIKMYIKKYNLSYCSLYDKGEKSLGCIYCLFGIHLEKAPNRFQRMYHLNSKLYNYGLNNLNIKMVLNHINVDYRPIKKLDEWW
ncbi:Phosphoadenosine phosphosulfate reductase [subsurface metagenome]